MITTNSKTPCGVINSLGNQRRLSQPKIALWDREKKRGKEAQKKNTRQKEQSLSKIDKKRKKPKENIEVFLILPVLATAKPDTAPE